MSVNGLNMMKRQFMKVKQIADQTFQRGEKTEVLNDELSAAEKQVDFIKQSCQISGKKLSLCTQRLATDGASSDRRSQKKIPEAALAQCMEEWGLNLGENSLLGLTMVDCGRIQETLATDLLSYKTQVEASVVEPLQNILKVDVANVAKCRKQLTKLIAEYDAAKQRHQAAIKACQQVSSTNIAAAVGKADSAKEEMEDTAGKVDQCRDMLATEMFSLISREAELSNLFVKLCHLQMNYHRSALSVLESSLPDLEAQIHSCPNHPVFGQSLEDHLHYTNREIALVLETCVCWLLERAISEEGLFRIGGSVTKIKKMKSAFDAGLAHLAEEERDPHNIAGLLKLYLRSLPEPLLTHALYNEWIEAARICDHDSQLQAVWRIVNSLPEANYKNLKYLIKFLSKLCQNSDVNKMSSQNIAIVMGPNLLWSPIQEGLLGMNMTATNLHSSLVDVLITYANWFFPGDCEFRLTTPTSPYRLHSLSDSLTGSQLSLSTTTKLSNGDSAVDSLSSSPTNSPKSLSPKVTIRTKKKKTPAPLAPTISENFRSHITRSLSYSPFQPNEKKDIGLLSQSHEDLFASSQVPEVERTLNANKLDSGFFNSVPVIKPGRNRPSKSLPPVFERPSVPPPDIPSVSSITKDAGLLSFEIDSDLKEEKLKEDIEEEKEIDTNEDGVFTPIQKNCDNADVQYCTVISVGDEYEATYKFSPPQDSSIKLRVNSSSTDTRL